MKIGIKGVWLLTREAFSEFITDIGPKLGASLAFYTMFSVAPVLLIAIAVAGAIFGPQAVRGEIVTQVQDLVGYEGAQVIETMLRNAYSNDSGSMATIIGVIALVIASTTVFAELQESLNMIWNVKLRKDLGFMAVIRDRILSFAMVVALGFMLMVSLVVSAALAFMINFMQGLLPMPPLVLQLINVLVSVFVFAMLFAIIYRFLPDVEVSWHDVKIGATVTAVLFVLGKFLIGLYLGNSSISSSYGAAGSFAVLMVWVYWSAQILFFGAELTQVYSRRYGTGFRPRRNAVAIANPLEADEIGESIKKEPASASAGQLDMEFPGPDGEPVRRPSREAQRLPDKPLQHEAPNSPDKTPARNTTLVAAGIATALLILRKLRN